MNTRKPTFEELFPVAYGQDLLKKQSEHFVNKSIAHGAIEKGYENLPTELHSDNNLSLTFNSSPPRLLIGTYLKNNCWIILSSIALGGVIWYFIENQKKSKKTEKKLVK
jgi:uncharacterized membrane protein